MHLMCTIINGVDIFRADIARIKVIVYYNFGNYDLGWEIQLGRGLKQG